MSGISDLGMIAMNTTKNRVSPLNTVLGGLAKGAEAHLNLKKMFDMYSMQMQWQEAYEGRKRTAEHAQAKELKGMENTAASERALINYYGVRENVPGQYAGMPMQQTSEGGSVVMPPGTEYAPGYDQGNTTVPSGAGKGLSTMPGYTPDMSSLASGEMSPIVRQATPYGNIYSQKGKGGKMTNIPTSRFENRPMPQEYNDIINAALSNPNDKKANNNLLAILPHIESEAKKGNPYAIILYQQISDVLSE